MMTKQDVWSPWPTRYGTFPPLLVTVTATVTAVCRLRLYVTIER